MRRVVLPLSLLAGIVLSALAYVCSAPTDPCAGGKCPVPAVKPALPNGPPKAPEPRSPWGESGAPVGAVQRGTVISPDGKVAVQCDLLPKELRMRNVRSKVGRGAGMCVNTAIEMAGRWAHVPGIEGFRDWSANEPGGSYAEKADDQLKRYYAAKGLPVPPYLNLRGIDTGPVIEAALNSGRYVCTTYEGRDGVNYPEHIDHMLNVLGYRPQGADYVAIYDNNFSDDQCTWMSVADFAKRSGGRQAWAFCWLAPGAPPVPQLDPRQ